MLRSLIALCLAALLYAQPVIALAWVATELGSAESAALCLTSPDTDDTDRPHAAHDGHCCILCDRPAVVLPDLDASLVPAPRLLSATQQLFSVKPAATGPPEIQSQPQQSRAPPSLA